MDFQSSEICQQGLDRLFRDWGCLPPRERRHLCIRWRAEWLQSWWVVLWVSLAHDVTDRLVVRRNYLFLALLAAQLELC